MTHEEYMRQQQERTRQQQANQLQQQQQQESARAAEAERQRQEQRQQQEAAARQTQQAQEAAARQTQQAQAAASSLAAQQAQQAAAQAEQDRNAYKPSEAQTAAKAKLDAAEAAKPAAYTPSAAVTAAQQQLQQLQNQKPQGYTSKYGTQLENILQQIQNPQQFKYDFNGDELFKYYADLYGQNAKQASMDAMGQAAALTGGYGNSWAQQAGQQAYDETMRGLYDRGMELRNAAYQQYQDEKQDLYNRYGILQDLEKRDYDRYRDAYQDWANERTYYTDERNNERNFDYSTYRDQVGDWQSDRGYYADQYNNERNFDYNAYRDTVGDQKDERDYMENKRRYDEGMDYQKERDAVSDAQYQQNFDEQVRQFNESLDWDKMSAEQKYAAEYCMQILANGQMPTEEMLAAAGLSAEDAQKLLAAPTVVTVGGGTKKQGNTYYKDANGLYYTYDAEGNARPIDKSTITKEDSIDYSEIKGQQGKVAVINESGRDDNEKLKKHYGV